MILDRKVFSPDATFLLNVQNILSKYPEKAQEIITANAKVRYAEESGETWEKATPMVQSYYLEQSLGKEMKRFIFRNPKRKH